MELFGFTLPLQCSGNHVSASQHHGNIPFEKAHYDSIIIILYLLRASSGIKESPVNKDLKLFQSGAHHFSCGLIHGFKRFCRSRILYDVVTEKRKVKSIVHACHCCSIGTHDGCFVSGCLKLITNLHKLTVIVRDLQSVFLKDIHIHKHSVGSCEYGKHVHISVFQSQHGSFTDTIQIYLKGRIGKDLCIFKNRTHTVILKHPCCGNINIRSFITHESTGYGISIIIQINIVKAYVRIVFIKPLKFTFKGLKIRVVSRHLDGACRIGRQSGLEIPTVIRFLCAGSKQH